MAQILRRIRLSGTDRKKAVALMFDYLNDESVIHSQSGLRLKKGGIIGHLYYKMSEYVNAETVVFAKSTT